MNITFAASSSEPLVCSQALPYLYMEANMTLMPPLIATGAVKTKLAGV
jgi:hypothetical protein